MYYRIIYSRDACSVREERKSSLIDAIETAAYLRTQGYECDIWEQDTLGARILREHSDQPLSKEA